MTLSSGLNQEPDYTSREQWEKLLKSELKIEDVQGKTKKNSADGGWPVLSLETSTSVQIPLTSPWKKAAQTYIAIPDHVENWINEDLDGGVRAFYFEKDFMSQGQLDKILTALSKFKTPSELEVILLGEKELDSSKSKLKIIDEKNLISGRFAWAHGGNNIQELAVMCRHLIKELESGRSSFDIAVFLGPSFFRNIAKVRAAKLLVQKILDESKLKTPFSVTALSSYREWTLFERYSNILRNDAAVASAFIGGADHVQSAGYQALFELEAQSGADLEHAERSRRMARNTSHILALESMLGVVGDAAFGSYHLESLTQELCSSAWKMMQKLQALSDEEGKAFMKEETDKVREERRRQMNTRKLVMAGTNDYADLKDAVGSIKLHSRFFRLAQEFEAIRLKAQSLKTPKVFISLYGDYAALNARMNFAKNYFELLGMEVTDPGHSVTDKNQFLQNLKGHEDDIVVICSSDDLYPEIAESIKDLKAQSKFVAGKVEVAGFENLFAGQNVYEVLSKLVTKWSMA